MYAREHPIERHPLQRPSGIAHAAPVPLCPLITHGHRSGTRMDPNEVALDRLTMTKQAVLLLKREGLRVIDLAPMRGLSPRIEIEYQPMLQRLLQAEIALLVRSGQDKDGARWRDYEFKVGDCRVFWHERSVP